MATTATAVKPQPKAETTTQTPPASSAPANGNGTGRQLAPIEQVGQQLEAMTPKFASSLPAHIPVERFKRVVLTAINLNPKLLNADRRSLFNAASKAAADGLMPDGREGALVIYNTKMMVKLDNGQEQEKWVDAVQWMPMTQGVIKLIRQSGEIAAISARCVYENEVKEGRFSFKLEDGVEKLTHEPILFGERGKLCGVYAVAKFKDGTVQHEPLTAADIAKIKGASKTGKAGKGPWIDWEDEMWRKSAVRRLRKYLPTSGEDLRVLGALDRDFHETEIDQIRAANRPQSIVTAAAALAAPTTIDAGDGETADAETGEVIQGEVGNEIVENDAVTIPDIQVHQATDGQADLKRWHADAMAAIPSLASPAEVDLFEKTYAIMVKKCADAKRAWGTEIGDALQARTLELGK